MAKTKLSKLKEDSITWNRTN